MDNSVFQNASKAFSVVIFIQESTFESLRRDLEALGNQRNVKLVVQPCPYEGIEFLYQVDVNFPNGHLSQEKEFFWHALEFKRNVAADILDKASKHHHSFLVSILQNDTKKVQKERKELESIIQKNS